MLRLKPLVNVLLHLKELHELQENLRETCVVVQMDNSRALNMDKVVSEVKQQYQEIAARSRQEAENWHRTKVIRQTFNNEEGKKKHELNPNLMSCCSLTRRQLKQTSMEMSFVPPGLKSLNSTERLVAFKMRL